MGLSDNAGVNQQYCERQSSSVSIYVKVNKQ